MSVNTKWSCNRNTRKVSYADLWCRRNTQKRKHTSTWDACGQAKTHRHVHAYRSCLVFTTRQNVMIMINSQWQITLSWPKGNSSIKLHTLHNGHNTVYRFLSTVHHSPITAGCMNSDPLSVTVLLLQDVQSVIHCLSVLLLLDVRLCDPLSIMVLLQQDVRSVTHCPSWSYYCRMYDQWPTVHHGPITAGCMISDPQSIMVLLLQDVWSVTHCPSWSYYCRMYDQWPTVHHGPITTRCTISDPLHHGPITAECMITNPLSTWSFYCRMYDQYLFWPAWWLGWLWKKGSAITTV